jgi:hypothetical protein
MNLTAHHETQLHQVILKLITSPIANVSAVRHAYSSAKFVSASPPEAHRSPGSAERKNRSTKQKPSLYLGWGEEDLCYLYSSLSIIRIIKSRRMRGAGHVARMGEKRNAYRLLVGKPEGKETTRKTKT